MVFLRERFDCEDCMITIFRKFFSLVLALCCLLSVSADIFAQDDRGTIRGRIVDSENGEPLPAVNVAVPGTYYGAATDFDGFFEITGIRPGTYTVEISMIGFQRQQHTGIRVEAGETIVMNVELEQTVLTLDQEVVVVGERPLVDIEETASRRVISSRDIEVAVVENVRDIVVQQAGVVQQDEGIHIRGGRAYETSFLLDGVSVQDPVAGTGFGLELSSAAIEEVEMITGGFNAEYGQAMSGIINVRTRDGGDRYTSYLSYKSDKIGFSERSINNLNTDIVEFTLSGPELLTQRLLPSVGLDFPWRMTFFMNFYMGISDGLEYARTGNRAEQLYSSTFYGTRFAPRQNNTWSWLGKVNLNFSPTIRLEYTYTQSVNINQNAQTIQTRLEYVEPSPGYQYRYQYVLDNANTFTHNNQGNIVKFTHTLSPRTFYEVRLSRFYTNLRADANGIHWNEYEEPQDIVTLPLEYYRTEGDTIGVIPGDGFYNIGHPFTWRDHYVDEYTVKVDLTSHFSERRKFKGGFEATFQDMQVVDIYQPWVPPMGLNNDIYQVNPAFGAFYVQETITFSGMILNAGLRFDYWFPGKFVDDAVGDPDVITIPDAIRERYMDETYGLFGRRWKGRISPRVGISHPVTDNQTLFFSYGHFSKRPRPQFVYAKLTPAAARSTFQRFGNPALNPETTVAYEMGLRSQLTQDDVLTVTAYYRDIFDYVSTRTARIESARFLGGNFITYVNQDYARSRGIEVEYRKRVGRWFTGNASFTYSVATGKSSSADEGVLVLRGDLEEQIAENYLIWDRPFQFSFNTNFFVPRGQPLFGFSMLDDISLHVRAFYQSGRRYTPMYRVGETADGRPIFESDRTNLFGEIGDPWFWVDLNFEKQFRAVGTRWTFFMEVINLFDNKNSTIINPVTGQAYEQGDPTPNSWNDPLYPDLQAPLSPYPFNPARYLTHRNIRLGLSFRI
jgi:outer membrane receptor protein involved in Fe transport